MLGKIVEELLNENRSKGSYDLKWNASKFASGVYIVRMTAQSLGSGKIFTNAIKMVYMK
jgi:hypothetical protein